MPGAAILTVVDVLEVHMPAVFVDGTESLFGFLAGRVWDFAAGHGTGWLRPPLARALQGARACGLFGGGFRCEAKAGHWEEPADLLHLLALFLFLSEFAYRVEPVGAGAVAIMRDLPVLELLTHLRIGVVLVESIHLFGFDVDVDLIADFELGGNFLVIGDQREGSAGEVLFGVILPVGFGVADLEGHGVLVGGIRHPAFFLLFVLHFRANLLTHNALFKHSQWVWHSR